MAWYLWVLMIYLLIGAGFDFYGVKIAKEPPPPLVLMLVFVGWLPMILGMLVASWFPKKPVR
jgi:hypothetical protein